MVCPYNASRDSVRKDLELSGRNLRVSRYEHQKLDPFNPFNANDNFLFGFFCKFQNEGIVLSFYHTLIDSGLEKGNHDIF